MKTATMDDSEMSIDLTCTRDDNLGTSLLETCASLLSRNEMVDCTISCKDGNLQAHRIVLASASTYMYNLLTTTPLPTPCSHPILFLRSSTVEDVRRAIEFIYTGKTKSTRNKLQALLNISNELECDAFRKVVEAAIATEAGRIRRSNSNSTSNPTNNNNTNNNAFSVSVDQSHLNISNSSNRMNPNPNPPRKNPRAQLSEIEISTKSSKLFNPGESSRSTTTSRSNSNSNPNSPQLISIVKHEMLSLEECHDDQEQDYQYYTQEEVNPQNSGYSTNNPPKRLKLSSIEDPSHSQIRSLKLPKTMTSASAQMINTNVPKNNTNGDYNNSNISTEHSGESSFSAKIHHDKSESFIYTNEDFGMKMDPDEDENESGGDDDNEIEITNTRSISSEADPNIEELLQQAEVKEEDDETASQCPWCMQVFTNVVLLQQHLRTHVNNYRPFTCDYCHNSFARSAHLKRHLRTHTGEKPYVCNICQRAFARQDKLKGHVERHLHHASKNTSMNPMIITSYPPTPASQSSGGQLPIKVLLPMGKNIGPNSGSVASPSNYKNLSHSHSMTASNFFGASNRFGIGSSNNNGLSISLATSMNAGDNSRSNKSGLGGLTVTPANLSSSNSIKQEGFSNGDSLGQKDPKRVKPATRKFLVT